MTRTDLMASSRPKTQDEAPKRKGSSRSLRALPILPAVLAFALALVPGVAIAAEPTSGYNTTPPPTTTPATGTLPSKESEKPASTTPAKEVEPAKVSTTPTTTAKTGTLPFTGFDLRWDLGFGLLLMFAGFLIVAMQRRQRRDS